MTTIHIGEVAVTHGACDNPYTYQGPYKFGKERARALRLFRLSFEGVWHREISAAWIQAHELQLWFAPAAGGGARKIQPSDVNWEASL